MPMPDTENYRALDPFGPWADQYEPFISSPLWMWPRGTSKPYLHRNPDGTWDISNDPTDFGGDGWTFTPSDPTGGPSTPNNPPPFVSGGNPPNPNKKGPQRSMSVTWDGNADPVDANGRTGKYSMTLLSGQEETPIFTVRTLDTGRTLKGITLAPLITIKPLVTDSSKKDAPAVANLLQIVPTGTPKTVYCDDWTLVDGVRTYDASVPSRLRGLPYSLSFNQYQVTVKEAPSGLVTPGDYDIRLKAEELV